MVKQERFSWIDEFLDATEESLGLMDLSTLQPTSWRHFQPLIAQEWLRWFAPIIEKSSQYDAKRLAPTLEPDLCREHLLFTAEDLKSARIPKAERMKFAEFFYELLKAQMPHGDAFGLRGTTKKHTDSQIAAMRRLKFEKGAPETARELGRLYNGAYNLGAALYLDFYMGLAVENFGPYKIGKNKILVVKEMRNLRPKEIWPHLKTKANRIVLYTIYKDVEFCTDMIACHTRYSGDIIHGLVEWRLEVDGTSVRDIAKIRALSENLASVGASQWKYLMKLPEPALLKKAIWVRCFCFKHLLNTLRLSWEPSKELLRAVHGKSLREGWSQWRIPKSQNGQRTYWRRILDPRDDFYPDSRV